MIIILFKSLGKRTSIGSYYDEKSLTKCYWDGVKWLSKIRLSDRGFFWAAYVKRLVEDKA